MSVVGLGVDLVDLRRIERLTARDEGIFRSRILGDVERAEIPSHSDTRTRNLAYACSVAAKEAFLKALGTGLLSGGRWSDVEMVGRKSSQPELLVSGETGRCFASLHAESVGLSVSVVNDHALAMVVLSRNSDGSQV